MIDGTKEAVLRERDLREVEAERDEARSAAEVQAAEIARLREKLAAYERTVVAVKVDSIATVRQTIDEAQSVTAHAEAMDAALGRAVALLTRMMTPTLDPEAFASTVEEATALIAETGPQAAVTKWNELVMENARLRQQRDAAQTACDDAGNVIEQRMSALGRAVAALQEAKRWMGERVMDLDDDHYGRYRAAMATVDAILADPTSAQAGEAWRELFDAGGAYLDLHYPPIGSTPPRDWRDRVAIARDRVRGAFAAFAAVDARRGGE